MDGWSQFPEALIDTDEHGRDLVDCRARPLGEMADAGDSKSPARKGISVRVRERAPVMPPIPGAPPPGERIRTLSGISGYACGHTGSCCHAGWPIPVESVPMALLDRGQRDGLLPDLPPDRWVKNGVLGQTTDSNCLFHAPGHQGGGCRLEMNLSSEALPFSCRQFPRVLLRDAHGWQMSVSAWCGTAATLLAGPPDMLSADGDRRSAFLSIAHIDADPRVHVEALDAHEAWPPLLRPGVLAGHDGYALWEQRILGDCLSGVAAGAGQTAPALASALCWTDRLRQWRPMDGALVVLLAKPFPPRDTKWLDLCHKPHARVLERLADRFMAAVPARWQVPNWPMGLTDRDIGGFAVPRTWAEASLSRYLGTRLMASWVAYQGQGLRSVLASLVSAHALATLALHRNGEDPGPVTIGRLTSALRASDWLLLHLLDRDQWAAWCSEWEERDDSRDLLAIAAAANALLGELTWGCRDSD
jgi:hypothetical protein